METHTITSSAHDISNASVEQMEIHAEEYTNHKLYSETVKTPAKDKRVSKNNSQKRDLSVSPEVIESNIKILHSNTNNNTNKR